MKCELKWQKSCKTEKQLLFSSSNTKLGFYQLQFNTVLKIYSCCYTVILHKQFCCHMESIINTTALPTISSWSHLDSNSTMLLYNECLTLLLVSTAVLFEVFCLCFKPSHSKGKVYTKHLFRSQNDSLNLFCNSMWVWHCSKQNKGHVREMEQYWRNDSQVKCSMLCCKVDGPYQ